MGEKKNTANLMAAVGGNEHWLLPAQVSKVGFPR